MKARDWTMTICAMLALVLIAGFILLALQRQTDRYQVTYESIHRAREVILGCIAFRSYSNSEGKYPASLEELSRSPFLEDPKRAVLDGTGKRLRFAVVVNEKGEQEA